MPVSARYGAAVAILLGLITAAFFGAGDFFGGLSTKKTSVLNVVALSHSVGLAGVVVVAPIIADAFAWRDVGIGAIAGLCGGLGVALLYRGLSIGPMAVVAPLTAIASAAVPAIWGVLTGESLSPLAWLGIFVALIAIGLSSVPNNRSTQGVTPRTIVESLAAGVGFGSMFILFDLTTDAVAPWPVVGARVATTTLLLTFILIARRSQLSTARPAVGPIVITGLFDTGSNVIFLIATTLGDLSVVAVLSSLYPVTTVILARTILDERMSRMQFGGLALALVATMLIALG